MRGWLLSRTFCPRLSTWTVHHVRKYLAFICFSFVDAVCVKQETRNAKHTVFANFCLINRFQSNCKWMYQQFFHLFFQLSRAAIRRSIWGFIRLAHECYNNIIRAFYPQNQSKKIWKFNLLRRNDKETLKILFYCVNSFHQFSCYQYN